MDTKICMIGDSIVKGVSLDSISGKYIFLKENFTALLSNAFKGNVINGGKFGCTVTKAESLMKKYQDVLADCNYICFEFGGNDSDFDWKAISETPDALHLPKTTPEDFEKAYAEIIERTIEQGGHPILLNLPPIHADRYFKWISRALNGDNILKWLGGSAGYIYSWHEMYNMKVCTLAQKLKVPMIDIRSSFLRLRDYGDCLCEDGIHPNSKGHSMIAQSIENWFGSNEKTALAAYC